nr:hypothetical protein [Tanacetum cinerariifolium]
MHNNIMAAGSRNHPPMLAPGRYPQWRSRFLRYVDTRPDGEALRKCILSGPYKPTTVLPEWSRFVAIVKQQHKLDEVSYHKLFDILKQYQNEVNELCAEKLARNANPLALVATAQASQDPFYQSSRSHRSSAPLPKPSILSRSHTSTRHKGKEISKPITPPSETASENDNDPKQAQKDKDIQKILALIAKYFKKIYKPTNNNLRTSSNSKKKNVDTTPRKSADTDEEVDEQELEAHYSYMAKIQEHSEQSKSVSNTCLVEMDDRNVTPDSPDLCEDDIQNDQNNVKSDDERVALANLIANLKLDTKQTEFEKYKAFNDRTVDYDKLKRKLNEALGQLAHKDTVIREGLKTKAYELSVVKEKHDELMKQSLLTKSHYEGLVKLKTKYVESLENEIDELKSDKAEFSNMYDEILPFVVRQPNAQRIPKPLVLGKPTPFLESLERRYFPKTRSVSKTNVSEGLSKPVTAQTLPQTARQAVSNTNVLKPGMYRIDNRIAHTKHHRYLRLSRILTLECLHLQE